MASNAPAFDPSKPFTKVPSPAAPSVSAAPATIAPAFDPSKTFTKTPPASPSAAGGSGGSSAPALPEPAAVAPSAAAAPGPIGTAVRGVNRSGSQQGMTDKPTFDDFMKGAETWARGASFGLSDDASAGLAAAILKANGDPRAMYDIYQQLDAVENERIDAFKSENPGTGHALEIGGALTGPGAAGVAGWIGRGASWLGRMGRAALSGAGTGAVAGAGYGKPGEKTRSAEIGGAVGGIVGPFGQAAGEYIAPRITAGARWLIDQGIIPTRAQAIGSAAKATEEKMSSLPVSGAMIKDQQRQAIDQFNTATFNNVLRPLGLDVDAAPGRESYAAVQQILSDRYDELLPRLTFNADPQFRTDIAAVDALAAQLPQPQLDRYIRIMNTQFADKMGGAAAMTGDTFKGVESELRRQASGLMKDPSWDNQELGRTLNEALRVSRDALARTNPTEAPQLTALNEAYARFTRLRDAMTRLGAQDGIFTPSQLLSAVKSGDKSRGKGAFAAGDALMQDLAETAKGVLSNTYPDSGTAGRLGMMHMLNPTVAATVGATAIPQAIPYVLGRGWYASPGARGVGGLLQQISPGAVPAAGSEISGLGPDDVPVWARKYLGVAPAASGGQ